MARADRRHTTHAQATTLRHGHRRQRPHAHAPAARDERREAQAEGGQVQRPPPAAHRRGEEDDDEQAPDCNLRAVAPAWRGCGQRLRNDAARTALHTAARFLTPSPFQRPPSVWTSRSSHASGPAGLAAVSRYLPTLPLNLRPHELTAFVLESNRTVSHLICGGFPRSSNG